MFLMPCIQEEIFYAFLDFYYRAFFGWFHKALIGIKNFKQNLQFENL